MGKTTKSLTECEQTVCCLGCCEVLRSPYARGTCGPRTGSLNSTVWEPSEISRCRGTQPNVRLPISPVQSALSPGVVSSPIETLASPEDTLHVLAALEKIGADAGEPIDISQDAQHHHVIVHANGLSTDRQQQITQVLKPLPRVVLTFDSRDSKPASGPICKAGKIFIQHPRTVAATI